MITYRPACASDIWFLYIVSTVDASPLEVKAVCMKGTGHHGWAVVVRAEEPRIRGATSFDLSWTLTSHISEGKVLQHALDLKCGAAQRRL